MKHKSHGLGHKTTKPAKSDMKQSPKAGKPSRAKHRPSLKTQSKKGKKSS